MVRAGAPLAATRHALAREAGLGQRALLGQVVDVGRRLDAVDVARREQPVGEQPLRLRAEAVAACGWEQLDPDVEARRLWIWAVAAYVPAQAADRGAILESLGYERAARLGPQRAFSEDVARRRLARLPKVVEAVRLTLVMLRIEHFRIAQDDVAQPHQPALDRQHAVRRRGHRAGERGTLHLSSRRRE